MNQRNGSLLRALEGPVMLIALGSLLAAHQLECYSFSKTWPLLLILFGLLKLIGRACGGAARVPPPGGDA